MVFKETLGNATPQRGWQPRLRLLIQARLFADAVSTRILTVKSMVVIRSRLSLLTRPLSSASIVAGLALTMAWVSVLAYGLYALVWSML